jgi:hypothetical protein
MDEIINPDRLVSVPFNKTRCGVDFYINTAINKDIGLVLTENKRFKTDFFSFYFFRKANGYLLLNFRKIELRIIDTSRPHVWLMTGMSDFSDWKPEWNAEVSSRSRGGKPARYGILPVPAGCRQTRNTRYCPPPR